MSGFHLKTPMKTNKTTKTSLSVSMPMTTGGVERHLRMAEAARLLGVSRATLYRWLPQIAHRRIPAGGLTKEIILIAESSLGEFLKRYEHKPEVSRA
jgi:excisionase family DNA binding protein